MASFSNKSHPFLNDSISSPNNPNKFSGFIEETESINFNWFYEIESSTCHHQSSMIVNSDNDPSSVIKTQSTDESTVVDKLENGEQLATQIANLTGKKRTRNGFSLNSAQSKDGKEGKIKKQKKRNNETKNEKKESKADKKDRKKSPEEPPNGYVHVRAGRGQATDRHSLAERVRRKKISERMEKLQRMVPGCDKITGKAFILDEIINYLRSLEIQVEFLSKKLASLNPMFYDFGVDLEALMVIPEIVNNIASPPLPPLQQCDPTQPIPFAYTTATTASSRATTTFAPTNNIPLTDTSATLLLDHGETPTVFFEPQDNGSLLWEVEDISQQFLNSFH